MWVMISPSGQNSGSVTGVEGKSSGVTALQIVNDSHWNPAESFELDLQLCGTAGDLHDEERGKRRAWDPCRRARYRRCEMKDELLLWEQRAADAAAPLSPCQDSDPALARLNYHKMGFSSHRSMGKNVQLKSRGSVDTNAYTGVRARARTALLTVTDVAPQLLRVHKSKACDGN